MKKSFLLIAVSACFGAAAFALDVPDPTGRYVSDFASLLSEPARAELEETLGTFDRDSTSQLLVVTLRSLEGDTLEDFSIRLAERWKPGTAKNDNGAILLIFKEDRAVRIEVGYGLEGALPDALAKTIIENELVPRFREGDFDGGVRAAVEAMMAAARGEYKASGGGAGDGDPIDRYAPFLFILMVLTMLLPWVAYAAILIFGISTFGMPFGFLGALLVIAFLHVLRKILAGVSTFTGGRHGPGGWSSGGFGGGFSGGGGGFSGGGGSFGGGGASGRW